MRRTHFLFEPYNCGKNDKDLSLEKLLFKEPMRPVINEANRSDKRTRKMAKHKNFDFSKQVVPELLEAEIRFESNKWVLIHGSIES